MSDLAVPLPGRPVSVRFGSKADIQERCPETKQVHGIGDQHGMNVDDLIDAIRKSKVRITEHADEEAHEDNLTYDEVYFSIMHGEVIEDYPNDKPYPSCLVLGKTSLAIPSIVCGDIIPIPSGQFLLRPSVRIRRAGSTGK
jgi:hypothetical protein